MQQRTPKVPTPTVAPVEQTPRTTADSKAWRQRHLLDLDTLSADEMEHLFKTADVMQGVLQREVKKVPTLRGRTILTLFYEASTRTRIAFETAGKLLSADVTNITVSSSSVVKGETLLDTVLTLQASAADVMVIRHADAGAPYMAAKHLTRTAVVNAGDGAHAHPTQALLDLFTARKHLGSLQGKKVTIVGDINYSRVARSNLWGFVRAGAHVVLSGPPTLIPWDLLKGKDDSEHPFKSVEVETDVRKAVKEADLVIPLRIQLERQQTGLIPSLREYAMYWQVNDEVLTHAHPHVLVMHPGPMNEGVEISSSVAHGVKSLVKQQVTNGISVRMAVLYLIGAPKEL
ncbi:MAG: aspartate carbamoyltransferase catalytic subunit [Dehalococcoidia bacterium]|nr:aspartate carbamoyltransferase catalytic subunit [Dehalococcoidia bacterium]